MPTFEMTSDLSPWPLWVLPKHGVQPHVQTLAAGPAGPAGSHLDYFGLRSGRRSTSGRNGSNGCIHSTPQESQEVTGILVLSEMF